MKKLPYIKFTMLCVICRSHTRTTINQLKDEIQKFDTTLARS